MQFARARVVNSLAVAAAIAFTSGMAAAAPASPSSITVEVPVLGQAWTVGNTNEGDPAVLTVHGVRRVEGATVVYWSIGATTNLDELYSFMGTLSPTWDFYDPYYYVAQGNIGLVDQAGQRVFRPLLGSTGSSCVCSSNFPKVTKGQAGVLWSAAVPMPPEVDTVDVVIGQQIISNIQVEDGPMEPLATDQENIVLGMGWPKIDDATIKQGKTPNPTFYPLTSRVSDLEETVTESKGEVSLNASVLFAKDAFAVSEAGKQAITKAAAQVKDGGAKTLTVTGHTDSDGSDASNLALSKKRAESVAAELGRQLGAGYTITADGLGETQPIAANETPEGKAKNRRVAITFTEGR